MSRSDRPLSTSDFSKEIIARLGQKPKKLPVVSYPEVGSSVPSAERNVGADPSLRLRLKQRESVKKECVGVDVFVDFWDSSREPSEQPEALAELLQTQCKGSKLELQMISNRGMSVWPRGLKETFCVDHWRCRFVAARSEDVREDKGVAHKDIVDLLSRMATGSVDFIKTEGLFTFDGEPGYSLGQGQKI